MAEVKEFNKVENVTENSEVVDNATETPVEEKESFGMKVYRFANSPKGRIIGGILMFGLGVGVTLGLCNSAGKHETKTVSLEDCDDPELIELIKSEQDDNNATE